MNPTCFVTSEDPGSSDALQLMDELSSVLEGITGSSGKASFDAADVRGPLACFALARDERGAALGCGAFRPLEPGVAEIKRMYARRTGAGIGTATLAFLETQAAVLGYATIRLETRLVNAGAVAFYASHGYARIANYGRYVGNPLAVCFEKRLATSLPA